MSAPTVKRDPPLLDEPKGKRLKVNSIEEADIINTNDVLPMFYDLEMKCNDYASFIHISIDSKLVDMFNKVKESIPRIVSWGLQSSGKSSMFNTMFSLDSPVAAGTGTLCPLEFRFSPKYSDTKYYVEHNGGRDIMQSFQTAFDFVKVKTAGELSMYHTIIIESKNPQSAIIVDLPGCRFDHQLYFDHLKHTYLERSCTTILHVVRGDNDPQGQGSFSWLHGIRNPIINVLTHTDMWLANMNSRAYLNQYMAMTNPYIPIKTAVINNTGEQEDNAFSHIDENTKSKICAGSKVIGSFLSNDLANKFRDNLPQLTGAVKHIQVIIDGELQKIGYRTPDMRELAGEFREAMGSCVTAEFTSNTDLARASNNSKKAITP